MFSLLHIKFIQALEPEDKVVVCNYSTNMIAKLESFRERQGTRLIEILCS